jgi:hypothetical protein
VGLPGGGRDAGAQLPPHSKQMPHTFCKSGIHAPFPWEGGHWQDKLFVPFLSLIEVS